MHQNDAKQFYRTLGGLEEDPNVRKMQQFSQHRGEPTFRHCHNVAVSSFYLAQRFGWQIDEDALARGAMLHDFHLYSRQEKHVNFLRHAFRHPKQALENAETVFTLSDKEKNIIRSHMWPLTLFTLPRSKEAFLVTLADKYCALCEMSGLRV